jgi:transposase
MGSSRFGCRGPSRSQFTALFARLAIDLLRECSVTGAVRLLRITWDEGWGIKGRAVTRGLARRQQEVVARLGVDEKAIAKRHRYLTVVADLEQSRVLYLADDRKQESLDGFWATLTPAQRDGITAVAMDMWEPYVQSTRAYLPAADNQDRVRQVPCGQTSARRRRSRPPGRAPGSAAGRR